jgi:hypothetical protein
VHLKDKKISFTLPLIHQLYEDNNGKKHLSRRISIVLTCSFTSVPSIHDSGGTSIMISSQSFLPAVANALSSAIMAIAYFAGAIASLAIQISIKFQDTGETLLAARLLF